MNDKILSIYTKRLADKKAKAINDFVEEYVPKWQQKVMLKIPSTVNLFGWKIVIHKQWGNFGERVELRRYGKLVANLVIIERFKNI